VRAFFLLLLISGSLLRIGYPWYVGNFTGETLAELEFFQRGSGWKQVKVELEKNLFPVGLKVRLLVDAPSERLSETGRFALKVRGPGAISYREILEFQLQPVGDGDADGTFQQLWQGATALQFVANEPYIIELEPLGKNPLSVKSAELRLIANIGAYDGQLLLIGTVMMGIGGIGFMIISLRRRRKGNKGKPEVTHWGRDS
jgi:hypothetical protein